MIDWSQVTIGVAALLVLFYSVVWNSKQQEKRDVRQAEHDEAQATRYEGLLEKYAGVTTQVIDVIRENTEAMVLNRVSSDGIKEAVESIKDYIVQMDRRLENGKRKFDDHENRLGQLEGSK